MSGDTFETPLRGSHYAGIATPAPPPAAAAAAGGAAPPGTGAAQTSVMLSPFSMMRPSALRPFFFTSTSSASSSTTFINSSNPCAGCVGGGWGVGGLSLYVGAVCYGNHAQQQHALSACPPTACVAAHTARSVRASSARGTGVWGRGRVWMWVGQATAGLAQAPLTDCKNRKMARSGSVCDLARLILCVPRLVAPPPSAASARLRRLLYCPVACPSLCSPLRLSSSALLFCSLLVERRKGWCGCMVLTITAAWRDRKGKQPTHMRMQKSPTAASIACAGARRCTTSSMGVADGGGQKIAPGRTQRKRRSVCAA